MHNGGDFGGEDVAVGSHLLEVDVASGGEGSMDGGGSDGGSEGGDVKGVGLSDAFGGKRARSSRLAELLVERFRTKERVALVG